MHIYNQSFCYTESSWCFIGVSWCSQRDHLLIIRTGWKLVLTCVTVSDKWLKDPLAEKKWSKNVGESKIHSPAVEIVAQKVTSHDSLVISNISTTKTSPNPTLYQHAGQHQAADGVIHQDLHGDSPPTRRRLRRPSLNTTARGRWGQGTRSERVRYIEHLSVKRNAKRLLRFPSVISLGVVHQKARLNQSVFLYFGCFTTLRPKVGGSQIPTLVHSACRKAMKSQVNGAFDNPDFSGNTESHLEVGGEEGLEIKQVPTWPIWSDSWRWSFSKAVACLIC